MQRSDAHCADIGIHFWYDEDAVSIILNMPNASYIKFLGTRFEVGETMKNIGDLVLEYSVGAFRIRIEFLDCDRLRWTRLEAPDGSTGTSGEEQMTITELCPNVLLVAFTEAEGNVIDVFDLKRKCVYINYVTNDGQRFENVADIDVVKQ